MKSVLHAVLWATISATIVKAVPMTSDTLSRRSQPGSIKGSAFTENNGFEAAVAAAPAPCYPESAVVIGSNPVEPNPGTGPPKGPTGTDPGDFCTDPGPWNGLYSQGASFPNYIYPKYCGGDDTWRVVYSIYWVHDGAASAGHKHDWESATVQWKRDQPGLDEWHRDALILSQHGDQVKKGWGDIQTVDIDPDAHDLEDQTVGRYRQHPKVYNGFFKHANYFEAWTKLNVYIAGQDEFRSNDWWFLPRMTEMRAYTDIAESWSYGDATSDPQSDRVIGDEKGVCTW
ncbi:MAG: hypothetical protein M1817_000909 [Caeruleum heppii]|nr:MAG: hypothetical protein M1817_000909 [Caeruleum heppii]